MALSPYRFISLHRTGFTFMSSFAAGYTWIVFELCASHINCFASNSTPTLVRLSWLSHSVESPHFMERAAFSKKISKKNYSTATLWKTNNQPSVMLSCAVRKWYYVKTKMILLLDFSFSCKFFFECNFQKESFKNNTI